MRVVIKVGSALVAPGGLPDPGAVHALAASVADLRSAGHAPVLVSSGAVASGLGLLGYARPPSAIVEKQACAAAGQPRLMRLWGEAFERRGLGVAQLLLVAGDLGHRRRFLNARHTVEALLAHGLVPIVNENDSVAFEEIRFGDNDRLSALTACLVGADALVILSTAGGLWEDGGRGPLIPRVESIAAARAHVSSERSAVGTGGMTTKLDAAEIATRSGIAVWIAPGPPGGDRGAWSIGGILSGAVPATHFPAPAGRAPARDSWLAFAAQPRGSIELDEGAVRAVVERGASVLPIGVVGAAGSFQRGELVELCAPGGRAVARGLVNYPADEVRRIARKKAAEIEAILGYRYQDEVVHRSDMVLL